MDDDLKNKENDFKKPESARPLPDPTKNIKESATTDEKLARIEEVVKELEHQEEIARREA